MKVYVKLEYVTNLMLQFKRPYWRLYDGNNKLLLDTIESELSVNDSIEMLTTSIQSFTGQYCICKVYDKKPTKNTTAEGQTKVYEYLISLDENKAATTQNNNAPGQNFIYEMFGKLQDMNIAMVKQQADFDKREMERKFDELKKEKSESGAGLEGLSKTFERLYFAYSQKNKPAATQPAATPIIMEPAQPAQPVKGIFGNDQEKQKFISLVKRWAKVDAGYLDAMDIVVKFAEEQNDQYKFYIQTLKNS